MSAPDSVAIRGGTLVDGSRADVLIVDGVVASIGASIDVPVGTTVLDASGCVVGPGLVDLHAHLREPGNEAAETVETGSRAAALGGYTAVIAMPRNVLCHPGGSISDETAKAAKTPTPTTLMMPIAVRSSTEAAAATTGGTLPINNTTRSGSLATPRMVK